MKLKQAPEDFVVEELTDVVPGDAGEFGFYKLEKTGWTTPDALNAIRRRWKLDAQRVSYGGLKDRHAQTTQYLTIYRGPQQNLEHERTVLTYLGRTQHAYSSDRIRANRFRVVLRHLTQQQAAGVAANAEPVGRVGTPNYFDDQRFGSVGRDGRFVASEMVHGRFEEALKLALAGDYEHDRAADKREKATLLRHWGDWPACKAALPRGHARSLVDYLVTHATDFRGAVARLRPDLGGMYLSAYQSAIWNRTLAQWLTTHVPEEARTQLHLKQFDLPAPLAMDPSLLMAWETLAIPLASARLKPVGSEAWLPALEAVLAEENLTLKQLRIPGMDRPYFSKGERQACLRPRDFALDVGADDRNLGKRRVTLSFELPRGCYATMIVKRIGRSIFS